MSTGLSWWDSRARAGDSSYGMDGAALLSMLVSMTVFLWLAFPAVMSGDWAAAFWRAVVVCLGFPILDWLFSRDWVVLAHALRGGPESGRSE